MARSSTAPLVSCTPDSLALNDEAHAVRFSNLSKRILGFERSRQTFPRFNPEKPGPWVCQVEKDGQTHTQNDYAAFRNSLLQVEEDVRIYSVDGHAIKFVIKESYAIILDDLRRLRLDLEIPELHATAQEALAAHPYGKRALPEDLLAFIDELADSRYFTRALLLDDSNIEDLWVRQLKKGYNADFISSAAVDPNGDLLFFKRELEDYLRTDLFHEWCHRLDAMHPELEMLFRTAILLEQRDEGWYFPSSYALTDFGEHWAVYGERMLACDRNVFEETCRKSAPRAAIWMRALKTLLVSEELERKGRIHDELLSRCTWVEQNMLPVACKWLETRQQSEDKEVSEPAALLHAELSSWSKTTLQC